MSFDSLTMKSLGNDRYRVEIGYETEKGNIEHKTFEGTREEIRQEIMAQKDLPGEEREDLLRALNMSSDEVEADFPAFYFTPDGGVIRDFTRFNPAF